MIYLVLFIYLLLAMFTIIAMMWFVFALVEWFMAIYSRIHRTKQDNEQTKTNVDSQAQ